MRDSIEGARTSRLLLDLSLLDFLAKILKLPLEVFILDAQVLNDVVLKGHEDRESK